jgi:DNA-directed RNA polymerase subunit H (RpoH/RPB5)
MSSSQSARYNPLISKIYDSRKVLINIFKTQRGYDVSEYEGFGLKELRAMYTNTQMDMLFSNSETGKQVFVKYHLDTKIKPTNIYDYIDDLFDLEEILKSGDELIIITKDNVNESLQSQVEQIYLNDGRFVNIYNINNYLFNILDNDLVPEHRVMTEEEKEEHIKKFYITDLSQFPEISRFDPVAQAIGVRPGDLVEIIRSSPTAITSKYYRLCH